MCINYIYFNQFDFFKQFKNNNKNIIKVKLSKIKSGMCESVIFYD